MSYVAEIMGQILYFIYKLAFNNYGLSIIIFTIFIRILLLPLAIKQYRSTAKLQELQPQIQELQRKYKNDKEKLNQEMLKLYQENKANPTGGCLPTLIQMPILVSLYWVIQSPLRYMLNKSTEVINKAFDTIPKGAAEIITNMKDISIINYYNNHPQKIGQLQGLIDKSELIDMNFLGIFNLGLKPVFDFNKLFGSLSSEYLPLIIIPILCWFTTFLSIRISTIRTAAQNTDNTAMQTQKSMSLIMPFVTMFFSFNVPAGLGLYWIVSNIFQILQQIFMNKFIIKKEAAKE